MSKTTTIDKTLILKRNKAQDYELISLSLYDRLLYRYSIAEIIMRFEDEHKAKANAYDFIAEQGLRTKFRDWSLKRQRGKRG